MSDSVTNVSDWSEKVASLAVDRLVDAGLVKKEDFGSAVALAAEEIRVRLTLGDYPPADDTRASGDPKNA